MTTAHLHRFYHANSEECDRVIRDEYGSFAEALHNVGDIDFLVEYSASTVIATRKV